jgi:hypothetical protein
MLISVGTADCNHMMKGGDHVDPTLAGFFRKAGHDVGGK